MNQIVLKLRNSPAISGAAYMVASGIAFAALNVLIQWLTMVMGFPSVSAAFWQYSFALIFFLPYLFRVGLRAMRTKQPFSHLTRVILSALGVQLWVMGLANVEIWQAIALSMTSPFFIVLGARLFLRESVGLARWAATLTGFTGAMIILQPWSDAFTWSALLPVAAALLWGASSLYTKVLTAEESPETITVWLLVLLTPINAGLAVASGIEVPHGAILGLFLVAGALTALSQYFLTRAYASADAAYVQPFDDLKLPLNVAAGWIVFGYAPAGTLWLGAILILGASLFLMTHESRKEKRAKV
ncbi:DMT family transporter [Rhizobium sp. L1K21]|uniref:DMT family transporter n=1 Tax=Rhizobium sp. L1K21 TaxID=2954933 RepID=UPI0020929676|nr:DMT family transporter [Rhizobium sp. L1K21]MCO6186109.1 DMT family transporter [Rhizobium sp. L1K21]